MEFKIVKFLLEHDLNEMSEQEINELHTEIESKFTRSDAADLANLVTSLAMIPAYLLEKVYKLI
jgi:hypothetical protein